MPSGSVLRSWLAPLLAVAAPSFAAAQTLTTFTSSTSFGTAAGEVVIENFSDATLLPFIVAQTVSGAVSSTRWVDRIASTAGPSTRWNVTGGTQAWGGTFDLSLGGVGGGIQFTVNFGGGVSQVVTPVLAGNTPAGRFFGFVSDTPFLSVELQLPPGATLQENYAVDNVRLNLLPATDVHLIQSGAATWVTDAHWDTGLAPGAGAQSRNVFLDPAGGGTVAGPTAPTSVRTLAVGAEGSAVTLELDAAGAIEAFAPGTAPNITVAAGSTLTGAGRLSGRIALAADTVIRALGDLTLGTAGQSGAFATAGTIEVGAHTVRVDTSFIASLGSLTTLDGGALLSSAQNFRLGAGSVVRGYGQIGGSLEALDSGEVIATGGTLAVGGAVFGPIDFTVAPGSTLHFSGTSRGDFNASVALDGGSITHINPGSYLLGSFNRRIDVLGGFQLAGSLTGAGTVGGALAATASSRIEATGDLTLGSTTVGETFSTSGVRTHGGGFETAGQLLVGGHTVTLLDADDATLATTSVTSIGAGGVLQSASGLEVRGAVALGDGATLRGQGTGLRLESMSTVTRAGTATFDAGKAPLFVRNGLDFGPTDTVIASRLEVVSNDAVELTDFIAPGLVVQSGDVITHGATTVTGATTVGATFGSSRLIAADGELTLAGLVINDREIIAEAGATITYSGAVTEESFYNSAKLGTQQFLGAGRHVFTGDFTAGFATFEAVADFSAAGTFNLLLRDGGYDSSAEITRESAKVRFLAEVTLGGTLAILLDSGFAPELGASFDVFDFDGGAPLSSFSALSLPQLAAGLFWDTTALFTTGDLFVTDAAPVPEPATWAALAGFAALAVAVWRRRR